MYKIVETSSIDGDEYPNEKFVTLPATTWEKAYEVVWVINRELKGNRFWKIEPEDYKLKPGLK